MEQRRATEGYGNGIFVEGENICWLRKAEEVPLNRRSLSFGAKALCTSGIVIEGVKYDVSDPRYRVALDRDMMKFMIHFDIVTIFPEVVAPYASASILGRAQKEKLAKIAGHDLRKFSKDKHRKVDDTPYGGGAGMVMTVQPIADAVEAIRLRKKFLRKHVPTVRVVVTSASGKRFTQADAKRLATYDQVIFICGRYEGIDHRVEAAIADEALSIGDYVLTGGELPALVMTDAITRLIPGVLGNNETLMEESHGSEGFLEYPQYTKPVTYAKMQGKSVQMDLSVPPVLLSGNHAAIAAWRKEAADRRLKG